MLTAPGDGGWFAQLGTGLCNHCANRFSFKSEDAETRDEADLEDSDPAVIVAPIPNRGGPVMYQPVRCPKCRSRHAPAHTTRPSKNLPVIIRYHRCNACGYKFKSVEQTESHHPPSGEMS